MGSECHGFHGMLKGERIKTRDDQPLSLRLQSLVEEKMSQQQLEILLGCGAKNRYTSINEAGDALMSRDYSILKNYDGNSELVITVPQEILPKNVFFLNPKCKKFQKLQNAYSQWKKERVNKKKAKGPKDSINVLVECLSKLQLEDEDLANDLKTINIDDGDESSPKKLDKRKMFDELLDRLDKTMKHIEDNSRGECVEIGAFRALKVAFKDGKG